MNHSEDHSGPSEGSGDNAQPAGQEVHPRLALELSGDLCRDVFMYASSPDIHLQWQKFLEHLPLEMQREIIGDMSRHIFACTDTLPGQMSESEGPQITIPEFIGRSNRRLVALLLHKNPDAETQFPPQQITVLTAKARIALAISLTNRGLIDSRGAETPKAMEFLAPTPASQPEAPKELRLPPGIQLCISDASNLRGSDDLVGLQVPKERIAMEVLRVLYPEMTTSPAGGILLTGYFGVGKSHLVEGAARSAIEKAAARGSKMYYIRCNPADIYDKWVGATQKNLLAWQNFLASHCPCIVFIDEIEAAFGNRERLHTSESTAELRASMLAWLTSPEFPKNMLFIGASNRPDLIDGAFTRSGRLETTIHVPHPSADELLTMFQRKVGKMKFRTSFIANEVRSWLQSHEFNPQSLGTLASAFTGADIDHWIRALEAIALERYEQTHNTDVLLTHIDVARAYASLVTDRASAMSLVGTALPTGLRTPVCAPVIPSRFGVTSQEGHSAVCETDGVA